MAKVTPITEHFQHFVSELKEGFWGDLQGEVQRSMRRLFELLPERQRDLYMVNPRHRRQKPRQDDRNRYYERDSHPPRIYTSSLTSPSQFALRHVVSATPSASS